MGVKLERALADIKELDRDELLRALVAVKMRFFEEEPPPPPPPPPVREVIAVLVQPDTVTIGARMSGILKATAIDKDKQVIDGIVFSWQSRDEKVAIVTDNGEFKSLAVGNTLIAAYAPNGVHGVAKIEVSDFGTMDAVKPISRMKRTKKSK